MSDYEAVRAAGRRAHSRLAPSGARRGGAGGVGRGAAAILYIYI